MFGGQRYNFPRHTSTRCLLDIGRSRLEAGATKDAQPEWLCHEKPQVSQQKASGRPELHLHPSAAGTHRRATWVTKKDPPLKTKGGAPSKAIPKLSNGEAKRRLEAGATKGAQPEWLCHGAGATEGAAHPRDK